MTAIMIRGMIASRFDIGAPRISPFCDGRVSRLRTNLLQFPNPTGDPRLNRSSPAGVLKAFQTWTVAPASQRAAITPHRTIQVDDTETSALD
jgi:hypothetical protein